MTEPTPPHRLPLAALTPGTTIALGPSTVTRDDIVTFARAFDPLPFHLDEKAARESLLGGLAASGWQTGALALAMLARSIDGAVAMRGLIGVDTLKWRKPVFVNDSLSGTATVAERRPAPDHPGSEIIAFDIAMHTGRAVPVLDMRVTYRVAPHPADRSHPEKAGAAQ